MRCWRLHVSRASFVGKAPTMSTSSFSSLPPPSTEFGTHWSVEERSTWHHRDSSRISSLTYRFYSHSTAPFTVHACCQENNKIRTFSKDFPLPPTNKTALVSNKHHSNFYTHISLDNEIMLLARDNHRSNACSSCRGAVVWNITQRIVSHHLPTFIHFSTLQHWQLETVCKK